MTSRLNLARQMHSLDQTADIPYGITWQDWAKALEAASPEQTQALEMLFPGSDPMAGMIRCSLSALAEEKAW
jgi:hypothetical protein